MVKSHYSHNIKRVKGNKYHARYSKGSLCRSIETRRNTCKLFYRHKKEEKKGVGLCMRIGKGSKLIQTIPEKN